MGFLQNIVLIWSKVGMTQRVLLIAVVLTATAGVGLIVHWARRPDMQLLYGGLGAEEASQIRDHLSSKDIPLSIEGGGSIIKVPAKYINEARLSISGAGLLSNQNMGYRILENQPIGISPAAQDVNIKRALQEELAFTIQTINGIISARVHITDEESRLFRSSEKQASASVTLGIRPGFTLTPGNVAAIRNLVAASVTGLIPDNVTVVDTRGTLLSTGGDQLFGGQSGTLQDYKERVERSLEKKVEDMLEATLGPQRAKVTVSAVIDTNNLSVRMTKHSTGVPVKEQIDQITETKPGRAADGQAGGAPEELKDKKTVTEYETDRAESTQTRVPGGIISRTVAVIVDLRPPDVNDAAGTPPTPLLKVSDVNDLVTQALGLGPADKITVIDAPIHRPAAKMQDDPAITWRWYLALAEKASTGVLALCALFVLMILQRARKKAAASVGRTQLAGTEHLGLLSGETAEEIGIEAGAMRKQIAATLKNDPDQVRQLFAAWLQEG